jgi:hypothetical protein
MEGEGEGEGEGKGQSEASYLPYAAYPVNRIHSDKEPQTLRLGGPVA